jgi:WD40 repeat protein
MLTPSSRLTATSNQWYALELRMQDLDTSKAEIVTNSAYAAGQAVPARWRPGYVFSAKTQPGGSLVATACSDGVLRVWDLRSQWLHTVCSLPLHEGMAAACAWDAHGHCLSSIATNGSITAMVNSRCRNVMVPGWYAAIFLMLWVLGSQFCAPWHSSKTDVPVPVQALRCAALVSSCKSNIFAVRV